MKKLGAKNTLNVPLITSGDVCRDLLVNKKNYFKNFGEKFFVIATNTHYYLIPYINRFII
ncbi:MAG: hypothetical protein CM15mP109_15090 [Candidatus Dadabacteria bacterium]|nr:MAG: hypothetical protein CM15mP109_15090 [Candidatus Dadabacteria bacterium]